MYFMVEFQSSSFVISKCKITIKAIKACEFQVTMETTSINRKPPFFIFFFVVLCFLLYAIT